jgi:hypothetical protein
MTLVHILAKTKMYTNKLLNIVIMGGSAKAEERLFCQTNYFDELTNFFPQNKFVLWFAGPELSTENKTV